MAASGDVGVAGGFTERSARCRLLEVDEAMLASLLGGAPLYLKGVGDEPMVLTTADATYAVQSVESSNTMFMCRSSASSAGSSASGAAQATGSPLSLEVQCKVGGVMQLTRVTPSSRRLRDLLLQFGAYTGPDGDDGDGDEGEGGDELRDASDGGDGSGNVDHDGNGGAGAAASAAAARGPAATVAAASSTDEASSSSSPPVGGGSMSMGMGLTQYGELLGTDQYDRTQVMMSMGLSEPQPQPSLSMGIPDNDGTDDNCGTLDANEIGSNGDGIGGSGRESRQAGARRKRAGDDTRGCGKRRRPPHPSSSSASSVPSQHGLTFAQLLSLVAMSEAELRAALHALCAIPLPPDGDVSSPSAAGAPPANESHADTCVYRLLDDGYALDVLDAALVEVGGQGLPLSAIDVPGAMSALEYRFPPAVTRHVLAVMFSSSGGGRGGSSSSGASGAPDSSCERSGDAAAVCLDFKKVALAKGLALLRAAAEAAEASASAGGPRPPGTATLFGTGWVPVAALLRQWAAALPDQMVTSVDSSLEAAGSSSSSSSSSSAAPGDPSQGVLSLRLLAGHVLQDALITSGAPVVRLFSHADLDDDPAARCSQLFAARHRWTEADIAPFLAPLAGPGRSVSDMLLTHARTTLQPDTGGRFFSAR